MSYPNRMSFQIVIFIFLYLSLNCHINLVISFIIMGFKKLSFDNLNLVNYDSMR